MERGRPTLPPTVIEGVLDVTTVYYIQVQSTPSDRTETLTSSTSPSTVHHETSQLKHRPVATVRPFPVTEDSNEQEDELTEDLQPIKNIGEEIKSDESFVEDDKALHNENTEEVYICDSSEEKKNYNVCITKPVCDSREEDQGFSTPDDKHSVEEQSSPAPQPPSFPLQSPSPSPRKRELLVPPSGKTTSPRQLTLDPCRYHRDPVRVGRYPNTSCTSSTVRMDMYQNEAECHNGQGCADHNGDIKDLKDTYSKETSITECLDEFLEELQLTHLRDYLRVLGCTCVRDLKLLEEPELSAIQLVSRRRLLKRLEAMSLHHEAPPANCSLDGWLTWYGLTHIAGFLNAIGVLTVGDMTYLKEEDLDLLKPVTRRRILSLYQK